MSLTPRENLLRLYRRQGYESAPAKLIMCPALWEEAAVLGKGRPLPEYLGYADGFPIEFLPGLPMKARPPVDWSVYYPDGLKAGATIDVYGTAHEPGSEAAFHMTYMRHPMKNFTSVEQIQAYPYPEYDAGNTAEIRKAVLQIRGEGRVPVAVLHSAMWERAWALRDMTMLMMDMADGSDMATVLLDRITDQACAAAAAYAGCDCDMIELGDDIGMQHAIMMSLDMYHEWLKPRLRRVIRAARAVKPDVLIHYHSCGYVEPFIEDLIEVGVDVLNPVQPECMDFREIHAKYGDRLSFNGTIGTQRLMPFGTPDEIRREVFRNLDIAGAAGGLFCCPTHILEPEVPWENIAAYVTACRDNDQGRCA